MVEVPSQPIYAKRDGNRFRWIRRVPCGLVAVRQRKLYDYGFQWSDDTPHPIQEFNRHVLGRR